MKTSTASESGGRFTLDVFPGQNKIGVLLPAGYVLKSITYDSIDVTTDPFDPFESAHIGPGDHSGR